MSIQMIGLTAYNKALIDFQNTQKNIVNEAKDINKNLNVQGQSFGDMVTDSLTNVNDLQKHKNEMIVSFASGETQNVHELMISMQKASVAMSMTSAVRNKMIEAYKEMSKLQF